MKASKKKRRPSVTLTHVWVKVSEAPEPTLVDLRKPIEMFRGDTLTLDIEFDELVAAIGAVKDAS